ncbi:unnamed protein product [Coccothraustes coccothraustes]
MEFGVTEDGVQSSPPLQQLWFILMELSSPSEALLDIVLLWSSHVLVPSSPPKARDLRTGQRSPAPSASAVRARGAAVQVFRVTAAR